METQTTPNLISITERSFEREFTAVTGKSLKIDSEYKKALDPFIEYINGKEIKPFAERKKQFIAFVNKKFDLNSKTVGKLYTAASKLGYTFNFHQKNSIQKAFDSNNLDEFIFTLKNRKIKETDLKTLIQYFSPIKQEQTIEYIKNECNSPSKLRIQKGDRDIENEVLKALFSAFLWVSLSENDLHTYFDPKYSVGNYRKSFWDQLQSKSPNLFNRDNALYILHIGQEFADKFQDITTLRNYLSGLMPLLFNKINNYGFLAIILEPTKMNNRSVEWEIATDLVLCGEKFIETPLKKNYFQWELIQKQTASYIKEIDTNNTHFELANEGFTYRDTFVLTDNKMFVSRLLVIFQKNERDETVIPCPACRSDNVQGNSYSSLGVRSWECNNPLCPDRSKYNRGKRYSFRGLLMQKAIEEDQNLIPIDSVRRWQRDVVNNVTEKDIFEMLIRHYSMYKDKIHLFDSAISPKSYLGRTIFHHKLESLPVNPANFFGSTLFNRYIISQNKTPSTLQNLGDSIFQVYAGDASEVLSNFPNNYFDGAVTSPPYYNAREYSQWQNIYCYLYDMFNINKQVYRTLKAGGIYLYNIFDYFDNEKTIALSAMAQKRMILSAYTVDLFRRIGYEPIGNIAWDKGDIEGKRGFNAGNFSPFYQAPFNCWEHILVFQKPATDKVKNVMSEKLKQISRTIFNCKPVIKIKNGENTHGHTAPFPDELPLILISQLTKKSIILDPFGGSLTTGRVAEKSGVYSVNIELSKEYCRLGLAKRQKNNSKT